MHPGWAPSLGLMESSCLGRGLWHKAWGSRYRKAETKASTRLHSYLEALGENLSVNPILQAEPSTLQV